jgi:nucleotidyltransferase/DNA polymerase involved in DNA repair
MDKQETLKQFQTIPSVGKSIAEDLWEMGFRSLNDLKGKDPEKLYEQLNTLRGTTIDRCMLYTFRCVVYFVNHTKHDPEKLKWWNWKDSV